MMDTIELNDSVMLAHEGDYGQGIEEVVNTSGDEKNVECTQVYFAGECDQFAIDFRTKSDVQKLIDLLTRVKQGLKK